MWKWHETWWRVPQLSLCEGLTHSQDRPVCSSGGAWLGVAYVRLREALGRHMLRSTFSCMYRAPPIFTYTQQGACVRRQLPALRTRTDIYPHVRELVQT